MSQAQETQPEPSQNSGRKTKPSELNLIWVDLEMTGLDPETDRIIEVALVVTDPDLKLLHIKHAKEINRGTHGRSGLIDRVRASNITEAMAEDALIEFLEPYVPKGKSPMCGNTICQDRRFMAKTMPKLEAYFH